MQQQASDPRVQKMFSGDRLWAIFAVVTLWVIYAFVFWKVWPEASSNGVAEALATAGALVLLFNTASIIAMISHYADDKDRIYGLDIHYLDLMKNA